ncbi:OmcA/MtrC family decaheme c-type cytochrome [Shewanella sp. AS1]|uniref:OmcA/MtrC family decaheme c-type cytochrome n=1 Tax=Shewanella sp. AS1 TaxID=2907626 RepID=UPI001F3AF436|nr:OmcA/MtrC family decaheme c-type cytochrome [Shewanella sp. AS1]MCE9677874.1 OmcA/MtrC family decaheme c-type cytochrome [Shewanella sp. AS1]
MKKNNRTLLAMALMCALGVSACGDGKDGKDGADGLPGDPGTPGAGAGLTVDTVESAADFILTLDPADIVVVGSDDFTIKFTATGKDSKGDDVPFTGLERVALYVTNQVANDTGTGAPMVWSNNAMVNSFGTSMYCNLDGQTTDRQGNVVEACTLVEDADNPGTYTGTWEHDGNAPVVSANGDPNSLFRVMIRSYDVTNSAGVGISDKLLSTPLDFIPATGALAVSEKDAVSSAACIQCHSALDGYDAADGRIANIEAHHNYQKVENCVACHNPAYASDQTDPAIGFNVNFNAMIHTIHAGGHLAEFGVLKGEALDNFGEVHFPAEMNECTVCHDNGDQWKTNVYAEACTSCHMTVDLTTGTGHAGIVPANDTACVGCHGAGSLSPEVAHRVGERESAASGFVLDFTDATVSGTTLTITANVTLNGAAIPDGTDLSEYMVSDTRGILAGNLEADGTPNRGLGMSVLTDQVSLTGGVLTVAKDFSAIASPNSLTGPIYVTAEVQVCSEGDMVVKCTQDANGNIEQLPLANSAPIKYFNLTDPNAAELKARMDDPDRVTVSEAQCNTCHGNLTHVKGTHGVTEFTQCMDCHNNRWYDPSRPGSFHSNAVYDTGTVDANGDKVFAPIDGVTFSNRDLMTVAHRFHAGNWDGGGIYKNEDMEVHGYPAAATDCQACHKEDAVFFAADGGLTSGKRSIQVSTTEYISPVAESCRSCHISASALAHFKSNGATVEGSPDTTADLPVESCATCHAEGKTYGVDIMHAGGAH